MTFRETRPSVTDAAQESGTVEKAQLIRADVTGLVLSGGLSRRFGSDKSEFIVDGEPLLRRMCRLVEAATGNVTVSVRQASDAPEGVSAVADLFPGEGPLAGLHAGLEAADRPWVLVAACDMPFLRVADLRHLLSARSDRYDAVVARDSNGRLHPLCGCYLKGVRRIIEEMLRGNERAVHTLLDRIRYRSVELPARSLTNINRPADIP